MSCTRRSLAITWALQWVLWLVFTDSYGIREVVAGAVGAAIASFLLYIYFAKATHEQFRIPARYVTQAIRIPPMLVRDTWILFRVIWRRLLQQPVPSGLVATRFDPGGSDAFSQGRRAFVITSMTLTPNTLVLDILEDRGILLFHTLIPQPVPEFIREIAAGTEQAP